MFLTPDDLAALTGRRRPAAQCRQLARMGIRFGLDADGHPRVLLAEVERAMLSSPRRREPAVRVAAL